MGRGAADRTPLSSANPSRLSALEPDTFRGHAHNPLDGGPRHNRNLRKPRRSSKLRSVDSIAIADQGPTRLSSGSPRPFAARSMPPSDEVLRERGESCVARGSALRTRKAAGRSPTSSSSDRIPKHSQGRLPALGWQFRFPGGYIEAVDFPVGDAEAREAPCGMGCAHHGLSKVRLEISTSIADRPGHPERFFERQ